MLAAEVIRRKRDGNALSTEELRVPGRRASPTARCPTPRSARSRWRCSCAGWSRSERVALTARDDPLRHRARVGPRPPGARQALDRRRRRQGVADAGADRRRLRRRGADDLRPRARPHRRHARQARRRPRLRHHAGPRPPARRGRARSGCAIVGQTAELAPADRRLYAIRDATGTVESIPLIVASILSKKLAAGLDALVMDVKFGSGAFMAERAAAEELARALVDVAGGAGLPTVALLTDMDEVLGTTAGNAVEVREAIDYLTGAEREPRLHEVTLALAASLLDAGRPGGRRGGRPRRRRARARLRRRGRALRRHGRRARRPGRPARGARSPPRGRAGDARRRARARRRRRRHGLPRGRPRGHRAGRQPPPRGRRDRPGRRPHRDRADRRRRSAPTGRWRSSTRRARTPPTRPSPPCGPRSRSATTRRRQRPVVAGRIA